MSTVIDQFIIKVKLDTSEYEAGQKKLDKATQETKERAKEAGNAFGDAAEAGAKRATSSFGVMGSMLGKGGVIGLAIGSLIYAGKILDDKLFEVARGVRQVGIDSKNFNIAAANMRNLQNASEMAGGSMEDANKTVGGLAGSLYNLKFNGAVDDSLIALGRLGVHFQDSYGHAKEFNAVMLETADAIDKAKASGKLSDSEAYFFAGQAGFTGAMQNLVTSGGANVRAELARQAARKQIDSGTLSTSTRVMTASTSLGQAVVAEGGLRGVEQYGDIRAKTQEGLETSGKAVIEWMSDLGDNLKKFSDSIDKATERVDKFLGFSSGTTNSSLNIASAIAGGPLGLLSLPSLFGSSSGSISIGSERAKRDNNIFNMMSRTDSKGNYTDPHDAQGFRIFGSAGEGIGEANRQLGLYSKRGINTLGSIISTFAPHLDKNGNVINDTDQYIAQMSKATGMSSSHVVTPEERAGLLSAMAMKESHTSISIGDININSQSGDMDGIANDAATAVKRKMLTAQAERGAQ